MVTSIYCSLALISALPANPAEVLTGSWWVKGNDTYGSLVIQVGADGAISGTIYDQPIVGNFDSQSGALKFTRRRDPADKTGIQAWSGKLTHVEGSQPPTYSLAGTFHSLAGEEFGRPGVEYRWSSSEIRHPAPAVDLKNLQGPWKVTQITRCSRAEVKLPDSTGLNDLAANLEVRENQLIHQGKVVATFANDLPLKSVDQEIGFRGYRPICLTLPNGQGLICSYLIQADKVEIAYPHTTACHRGSGHVVVLKRPE